MIVFLLVQEMEGTYAAICSALSLCPSKNGARVAFTARCASGLSCSKPFPQFGHASKLSLLDFLTNHSPQCQHFTTGVTHILIFTSLPTRTISTAFRQGRKGQRRLS